MVYTSTVPQGNQQIATTQPLIQGNFGFLATGIGVDHNFNASGSGTDMYHLQASMPNKADPLANIAGTNGQYYIGGGQPKFYNATQVGGFVLPPCNAYIQFNGSGSSGPLNAGGNSIRASFNINAGASTHDSAGEYTITFANTLPSANYLVLVTGMRASSGEVFGFVQSDGTYSNNQTTTFVKIGFESSGGTARDVLMGSVFIFGA